MKLVFLRRNPGTDQGTFGRLEFGPNTCYSLELPWRDNRRQVSCIPPGKYLCEIVRSPRFGRVYSLRSVPGRSHILIHPANFAGDAELSWTTELQGCIAPCERVGVMKNKAGKAQSAGLVSRPAFNRLMAWAAGAPFTLEIS